MPSSSRFAFLALFVLSRKTDPADDETRRGAQRRKDVKVTPSPLGARDGRQPKLELKTTGKIADANWN